MSTTALSAPWLLRGMRVLQEPALRAALAMPAPLARRLTGQPVTVDDKTLEPEIQLMLALQKAIGAPAVEDLPIAQGRQALLDSARLVGGHQRIGAVRDFAVPGPNGDLSVRHYLPTDDTRPAPTLVFFHGGGWVYGGLDSHDSMCRFLAEQAGVRVLAVDYRRAPEHPFPAAVNDCLAAYRWAAAHADEIGADAERLAVGGDSAGGNLAAVVALLTRDASELPRPAFQLLIYPAVDFTRRRRSRELFGEGFGLTNKFMDQCTAAYLLYPDAASDVRASPLLADDHAGLPRTHIVTAGFDPLLDEGAAYAEALRAAGVDVEYVCEESLAHSFASMVGVGQSGKAAMTRAATALRDGLSRGT